MQKVYVMLIYKHGALIGVDCFETLKIVHDTVKYHWPELDDLDFWRLGNDFPGRMGGMCWEVEKEMFSVRVVIYKRMVGS